MALALPPTYLLPTHLSLDSLHELEDQIPSLTYDITEATLVLGKVTTKQRALFELRSRKLWTEDVLPTGTGIDGVGVGKDAGVATSPRKRRKTDDTEAIEVSEADLGTESEAETNSSTENSMPHPSQGSMQSYDRSNPPPPLMNNSPLSTTDSFVSAVTTVERQVDIDWGDTVKVVKLDWFKDSLAAGQLLPLDGYLIYEGRLVSPQREASAEPKALKLTKRPYAPEEILSRAKDDAPRAGRGKRSGTRQGRNQPSQKIVNRPPHLLHQTTSEHDSPEKLPSIPDYLHTTYSCQRPTPTNPPNDQFIDQLKKIRTARTLLADHIGVRAYSTAIASLAAYPYTLTSIQEVLNLPGCDQKITFLYQQWKETGSISTVEDIESDPKLQVLNMFYEICGVGATTAREFYDKGWRELDDIVEYGWSTLTRVQQIGVKFYDEFQAKIPRAEVESISATILSHANMIHPGFHMCIVGGYRRGKKESGDVDVVLSHPDEACTFGFIQDIVEELEKGNWITHTLLLSMANSERGQTPVSWKGDTRRLGSGFDTLDKALLVWQDPDWPNRDAELKNNPRAKNPNIHRRVDIIISPWKTVGCAVAGWTSGTTFQRDLRRYAKRVKNLKFDSSGIRSRGDGHWIDFESVGGKTEDLLTAERRVFAGLGLEWREPTERCTG